MPPEDQLLRGLLLSCHPLPAVAVTAGMTALAAAAGRDLAGCVAVAGALGVGQLSIGWSNDAHDAADDRRVGRADKPTVRGWVTPATLWRASFLALALCVPMSILAAGTVGGGLHVLAVAAAWSYNLWLKPTVWSAIPYLVRAFGVMPGFITYGLQPPAPPAWWASAGAAALGAGAHLANSVPDIDRDQQTGTGGLAAAMGRRGASLLAVAALALASGLLLTPLDLEPASQIAITVTVAGAAAAAAVVAAGRWFFPAVVLLGLADIALLVAAAASLSG